MSLLSVLRILSEGRPCSLEQLAVRTNQPMDEIQSVIAWLGEAGMLNANIHDGVQLQLPVSFLDESSIRNNLASHASGLTIEVVAETSSTNDDLMLRARRGERGPIVRVAEVQTAGRGRRQRQWLSVPGGALTFSLLCSFDCGPDGLSGLPLAVGVALVRALHTTGATDVKLKWPNDLICGRAKLGGILVETLRNLSGTSTAIIGVGINVRLTPVLAQQIDQSTIDLASLEVVDIDRNHLLAGMLSELQAVLDVFARDGFVTFKNEWQRVHAYQDKMVRLELANGTQVEGQFAGVDDSGALLLRVENSLRVFHSGELSLRAVPED